MAEFFRRYNKKNENFSYEDLNNLVDTFAVNITTRFSPLGSDSNLLAQFVSHIFVTHYMNNKFLPFDALKLKHQEEAELQLFKNVNHMKKSNDQPVAGRNKAQTTESYLNYMKNKLENGLVIKKSLEEEKYIFLVKRLGEFAPEHFQHLLDEFLYAFKMMLLSDHFNEFFNVRMTRMISFLCRENSKNEFMNTLVFDLLATQQYTMPDGCHAIVVLMARCWPEFFMWPASLDRQLDDDFELVSKKNPILNVVIYIVKKMLHSLANVNKNISDYSIYVSFCMFNFSFNVL